MVPSRIDAPWAEYLLRDLVAGVREVDGPDDNRRIVLYHRWGSHWEPPRGDEDAWCASAVNAALEIGAHRAGSGRPNARSLLEVGEALDHPVPGCIAVYWRGDPNGWQGHTGIFLGRSTAAGVQYDHLLGGNQNNAVTVTLIETSRSLGYRWPFDESPAEVRELLDSGRPPTED